MSDYCQSDFATPDEGLDYLFVRMGAIYGAAFSRHWSGLDAEMVRDTWIQIIGRYLTYKPSLDFALKYANPDFIPSALAVRDRCEQGPRIPINPEASIGFKKPYNPKWEEFKKNFVGAPMRSGFYQKFQYDEVNK